MAVKKKAVRKKSTGKKKALTPRRLQFCFEYLIDLNASQAAIRAGYSEKTSAEAGYELLQIPEIKAIIKEGTKRKLERAKIDADWVLQEQVEIYKKCKADEPILDKDGKETGFYKFDASGSNKALENIGKHVDVNAFKATDDKGVPIDQNWVTTIVHTDARTYASRKT